MINFHNITKFDMVNGEGIRTVLWLSGCDHACKGCQNIQTWSHSSGIPFTEDNLKEIYEELDKEYISGLTLSGGDPLSLKNREFSLSLAKHLKEKYPHKNIWCYTGYIFEDIKNLDNIEYIDVIVDGKYIQGFDKIKPQWRGSSNQRIIDVKKSLETNTIVELYK